MTPKNILSLLAIIISGSIFSQSLKDAIKLTESEQLEKAEATYFQLLKGDPNNGEVYFYLGDNYYKGDNIDSARIMFQKGIDLNATNGFCYVGLGKVLWGQKNDKDAKTNFFKAIELSQKKNATIYIKIAEAYIVTENKNLQEAINLLNQAIKLDPNNPECYLMLGDAYAEMNDGTRAVENYNKAAELDKKSVKAYLKKGRMYGRSRNAQAAFEEFQRAAKIDSNYAPAYREKAEVYYRAGQYEKAVGQYRRYLSLNDSKKARERYAAFMFLSKDYKNAITEIKELQKKDSSNIILFRILGYSMYETGDYTNGLPTLERFFKKAEDKGSQKIISSDYEYLGKLLSKNGKDSVALNIFNKAILLDTSKSELYGDMAAVYFKLKKYNECIDNLNKKKNAGKTLTINDYNTIGRCHYILKDYVKADTAFSNVIRLQPTLIVGYLWRGKCNSNLDPDFKQGLAKPFYEIVFEKGKADIEKNKKELIEAGSYLGYYNFKVTKDYALSKAYWLKVQEWDPANEKAKISLGDVNLKNITATEIK